MERIIESFEEFNKGLNEKLIKTPKGGFTKDDVEAILKKDGDISLYVERDKATYFVVPHMHIKGKLEKGDDEKFFPLNKAGKAVQVKFEDISSITA
jgi:hypothetical protein